MRWATCWRWGDLLKAQHREPVATVYLAFSQVLWSWIIQKKGAALLNCLATCGGVSCKCPRGTQKQQGGRSLAAAALTSCRGEARERWEGAVRAPSCRLQLRRPSPAAWFVLLLWLIFVVIWNG